MTKYVMHHFLGNRGIISAAVVERGTQRIFSEKIDHDATEVPEKTEYIQAALGKLVGRVNEAKNGLSKPGTGT